MKVFYLINTLFAGGAELHLLTLSRYLKKRNVKIVVACLRDQENGGSRSLQSDFEGENIRVIKLQANSRYDCRFVGKVAQILAEEQPDILHTHLPRADVAGVFARFRNPSVAWVCSVHAIYSEDWSGRWSLPLFNILWRRADVMLCISQAVQDWLLGRGVSPHKTRVIHYGIEPEKFFEPRVNLREQWGLNDKAVIGSIGRFEPRKNHECLIAAMPQISKAIPNAKLLIAGHDPWGYGSTLRRQIEELGLGEKVQVVGFQNDIPSFLGALDVFAFSTNSEGFGQVLVEAMAMRKPVVASKIPPLTEIVSENKTGLLVERGNPKSFAEAIIRLLNDPDIREQMGACGRQRVKEYFTAERMTEETISIYEQLLGRKNGLKSVA